LPQEQGGELLEIGDLRGMKENEKPEVFMSDIKPTKETHSEFDIIYGPFKTVEETQGYIKAMEGLACGSG
jgi:hypothetical protein